MSVLTMDMTCAVVAVGRASGREGEGERGEPRTKITCNNWYLGLWQHGAATIQDSPLPGSP